MPQTPSTNIGSLITKSMPRAVSEELPSQPVKTIFDGLANLRFKNRSSTRTLVAGAPPELTMVILNRTTSPDLNPEVGGISEMPLPELAPGLGMPLTATISLSESDKSGRATGVGYDGVE